MSIWPSSNQPPSTRAFSKLTALPMLAPSPMRSKSGARTVTEPSTTSLPIFAPRARSHSGKSEEPVIMPTGTASTKRSASHQRK